MRIATGNFYVVRPFLSTAQKVIVKAVGHDERGHIGQRGDTGEHIVFQETHAIIQISREEAKDRVPFSVWA